MKKLLKHLFIPVVLTFSIGVVIAFIIISKNKQEKKFDATRENIYETLSDEIVLPEMFKSGELSDCDYGEGRKCFIWGLVDGSGELESYEMGYISYITLQNCFPETNPIRCEYLTETSFMERVKGTKGGNPIFGGWLPGVTAGYAIFEKENEGWHMESFNPEFEMIGIDGNGADPETVKIGPDKYGYLYEDSISISTTPISYTEAKLYTAIDNNMVQIFKGKISDYSQKCPQDKLDRPFPNYEAVISFDENIVRNHYYQLDLTTKIKDCNSTNEKRIFSVEENIYKESL
jgi:hypothetical protein